MAIELIIFAAGIYLFYSSTTAKDRIGIYAFWGLVVFILVIYVGNVFGPPPPDVTMIGIAGNASWLFVLWGYWVDRHRTPVSAPELPL
jgi:hypothetical protein